MLHIDLKATHMLGRPRGHQLRWCVSTPELLSQQVPTIPLQLLCRNYRSAISDPYINRLNR